MLKTLGEHAQAPPQTPSQRTKYFSFQASALTFLNYHASLHLDSYMRKNNTIPEFLNLLSRGLQDTIVTNMQASSLDCASPVRNATSGLSNAATPWTSCTALVNPRWASAEQRNGQGKRHSRKYSVKHSGHWRGLDKVFISNLHRLVIFHIHVFHTANATARYFLCRNSRVPAQCTQNAMLAFCQSRRAHCTVQTIAACQLADRQHDYMLKFHPVKKELPTLHACPVRTGIKCSYTLVYASELPFVLWQFLQ